MPNWCSNTITITGEKENIRTILKKIGEIPTNDKDKLFETLIGNDPDIDKIGWYESNLKRFGTKWDVSVEDCNGEFNEDQIVLNPSTAWSPPVPFCITLAKEYGVQVEIKYFEPGCDFAGRNLINEEGDVIEEEDYDYNEGVYKLDNDMFWGDMENAYLDEDELKNKSVKEHVDETYPYVDESARPRLVEIFEGILETQSEENSGD